MNAEKTVETAPDVRSFVVRVRLWMAGGLLLGAAAAWFLETRPETAARLLGDPGAFWGVMIATVGAGFALGGWRRAFSAPQARLAFLGFAALNGAAVSAALRAWLGVDATPAFLAAAGAFLAGDLVDARGAGAATVWLWMAAVGVLLAGPLSRRLGGSGAEVFAAYAAVALFTALAAWDEERVRRLGAESGGDARQSARGALALYLDAAAALLRRRRR